MNRVVHFEISADDIQRAVNFYSDVFGWSIEKWDGPMDYWLITTGTKEEHGIDGAIMKRALPSGFSTINTIKVDDIVQMLDKIEKSGGKKIDDIQEIPGVGKLCYCFDTEGNSFCIMQWVPCNKVNK